MKKKSKRKGSKGEDYLLMLLKRVIPSLESTSNSGARFGDGDLADRNWSIEVKSTKARSYRVTQDLIHQVDLRRHDLERNTLIAVLTGSEEPSEENCFFVIPWWLGRQLLWEMDIEIRK